MPTGSPAAREPATAVDLTDHVLRDRSAGHRPRWRPGDRLEHLFEQQCDALAADCRSDHVCVDTGERAWTYAELDRRANQLARYLIGRGLRPGARVALYFEHGVDAYVAMLAVLKAHAAYVPLDPGFPADRVAHILRDADVRMVLAVSELLGGLPDLDALAVDFVCLDRIDDLLDAHDDSRPTDPARARRAGDLAYIIYTSGSTGRPKGVAVDHASVCNFVRVAAEVYDLHARDRMYQGLTIAFDFSFEEIWVPWASGATLVPRIPGRSLLGADLHEFLTERRVTAMCCVPTLLATIEDALPLLRFLLVSGEACPQDLIARWWRADRRFLNVYGPTEATVTATWTELRPGRPVTIGVPLPTYSTIILDAEDPTRALPHGETGEVGIAGIGLACGYLNRQDLTDKAFVPDFLGIPDNPSGRIYRTGDLGRVNDDREIEYLGRIDLQVKVRGYRIELTEIESVLMQVPGIAQAVVDTYRPNPQTTELVGYYSVRSDAGPVEKEAVTAQLRERLPSYMVPRHLMRLDIIPMTPQDKADRKALPLPGADDAPATAEVVAPETELERALAEALSGVLGLTEVSVESHFFDDLGANSLLMAQFAARVRKQPGMPAISMRTIYLDPTVRRLATALDHGTRPAPAPVDDEPAARLGEPLEATPAHRASDAAYRLTGAAQLATFLVVAYLGALVFRVSIEWVFGGVGFADVLRRTVTVAAALLVASVTVPIAAKWALVGAWRPRQIRLWSPGYYRFWLVKTLIRASPMAVFAGTPLFLLYLRALGAKIGKGVALHSTTVPVATDLITVGDGAVVSRTAVYSGYRAINGVIQLGPVTIGSNAFVGEKTVLDIDTSIGEGGALGHSSALQPGQSVPPGKTWHGCPAEDAGGTDYRTCPEHGGRQWRRVALTLFQLIGLIGVAPLVTALAVTWLPRVPALTDVYATGAATLRTPAFYLVVGLLATALFLLMALGGLAFVLTVPRLLNLMITPGRVYPLYGLHYVAHRAVTGMTNSRFFMYLFGDSSAVLHYVEALGYDVGEKQQTGSNFGTELRHDTPYLTRIGTGTMVSDALAILNTDHSRTGFRVNPVVIGERNYLGNHIAYPAGGRTGDNVLLATKVMVPIDGPVREDVGLLGSPPFEIPRSVERDARFDHLKEPEVLRERLRGKNRHNLGTALVFLGMGWLQLLLGAALAGATLSLFRAFGEFALLASMLVGLVVGLAVGILAERLVMGFRRLTPRYCSIYDPYFWRHERLWKLLVSPPFRGTPFNPVIWRLAGVRMGRRVFDDGCGMPEKTLVTIGDDVTLNAASVIQCHSLEDGTFKSDRTRLGDGVTLGVHGFVHYGVTMGDVSVLETDAFLMKGEETAEHDRWFGNPARPEHLTAAEGRERWGAYDRRLLKRIMILEDELAHARSRRARTPAVLSAAAVLLTLLNVALLIDPVSSGPFEPVTGRLQSAASALVRGSAAASGPQRAAAGPEAAPDEAADVDRDEEVVAEDVHRPSRPAGEAHIAADDGVDFVRDHYSKLPGDVRAAFGDLAVSFQRRLGGPAGFLRLYREVASVEVVDDPELAGTDAVQVHLRTRLVGGAVVDQTIQHTLRREPDGGLRLADAIPRP